MKTKFTTFALLFFILFESYLIPNCFSRWVQVSSGMGNDKTVNTIAISGNNIFAGTFNGVYLSTNDGQLWTLTSLYNKDVRSLAVSGKNIFAGTYDGSNPEGVFLSTDNGQTWTQTALNDKSVLSLIIRWNYIFAGTTNSGIYLSTNSGQSWTQTSLNNQYVNFMATNASTIFAGTYNLLNPSGVYYSTNEGQSWNLSSLNNFYVSSFAVKGNTIFAGSFSGLYLSTNNGRTWAQKGTNYQWIRALVISGNNIIAGKENYPSGNNGVYLSKDFGVSWVNRNQGFNVAPTINELTIAGDYIYAATSLSLWRRSLSEIIGSEDNIPSSYLLQQNYPNPFNSSTNIKFQIPIFTHVKLCIFDILGKEITSLINQSLAPGTYETTFDASEFSSGAYFYRLQTKDFSETKLMTLVK